MGFQQKIGALSGNERVALYDEAGGNLHVTAQQIADLSAGIDSIYNGSGTVLANTTATITDDIGVRWQKSNAVAYQEMHSDWTNGAAGWLFTTQETGTGFGSGGAVYFSVAPSNRTMYLLNNETSVDPTEDRIGFRMQDPAGQSGFFDVFQVNRTGQAKLNFYGSNGFAGIPSYFLGVDGSGNIVESAGTGTGGIYSPGTGTTASNATATVADRFRFENGAITTGGGGELTGGFIAMRKTLNDGTGIPYQLFFQPPGSPDDINLLSYGLGMGMTLNGVSANIGSTGFLVLRGNEYGTGTAEITIGGAPGGSNPAIDHSILFSTDTDGSGGFRWRGMFLNQDDSSGSNDQVWTLLDVATGEMGWTTPGTELNGIFDASNEGGTVAVSNVTLSSLLNFNAQAFDGLRVSRDGGSSTIQVRIASDTNLNHSPVFVGYNSRGTVDIPTAVEVGRRIFAFNAFEHNGSGFIGNNLEFWKDTSSTQHTQLRLGLVYNGLANERVLTISGNNGVEFNRYGVGSYTGTVARGLAVDASGKVIETPETSTRNGIFDASNDGGTTAVADVLLSQQFRFYRETGGPIFAVSSYDGAQKPQYRANLSNGTLASPTDLSNAGHAFFSFLGSIRYEGSDRYLGGLEFWSEGTVQGGEFGPSNYHSSFRIQTAKRGATSRTTALKMNGHQLELPSYGVGSYTGTVAYGLAVTASGEVIETAATSTYNGIFDAANENATRAVTTMYVTDTLAYVRDDQAASGNTLAFRIYKGAQANFVTNSFSALAVRGTEASPSALNANDQIFAINSSAQVDGSTSVNVMQFLFRAGANWNATTNRETSFLIQGVENGSTTRTDILEMQGSDLYLHLYGVGSKGGTVARGLAVDVNGKVIETPETATRNGLWSASNESDSIAVDEIRHNVQVLTFLGTNAEAGKVTKFAKSGSGFSVFQIESFQTGGGGGSPSEVRLTKGTGTYESPLATTSGTNIGRIAAWVQQTTTIGDNARAGNILYTAGSNFTAGSNHHMVLKFQQAVNSTTVVDVLTIDGSDVTFDQYGSGNKTGTAAKLLAVDSSGNVIEEDLDYTNLDYITIDDTDSPYTVLTEDLIYVDNSSGAVTVNFPSAASMVSGGKTRSITVFVQSDPSTHNVTLEPNGAETIQIVGSSPATNIVLNAAGEIGTSITVTSNGSNLFVQ